MTPPSAAPGKIRIIAGKWRGRGIAVPPQAGLRPTPARLRETLFNWLAPEIAGSRCLDLFAGSGVLGLEALSRGAAALTLVEAHPDTARHLKRQLQQFGAQARLHCARAERWLRRPPQESAFHIAFLDPPFDDPARRRYCALLEDSGLLHDNAWIYLETRRNCEIPTPGPWRAQRSARSGDVQGALYRRGGLLE